MPLPPFGVSFTTVNLSGMFGFYSMYYNASTGEWSTKKPLHSTHEGAHNEMKDDAQMPMPFGKHKGRPIGRVPVDYLEWCLKSSAGDHIDGFMDVLKAELKRRADAEAAFRAEEAMADRRSSTSQSDKFRQEYTTEWPKVDVNGRRINVEDETREGRISPCAYCKDGVRAISTLPSYMHITKEEFCTHCDLGRTKQKVKDLSEQLNSAKCTRCVNGIVSGYATYYVINTFDVHRYCSCQLGRSVMRADQYAHEARTAQARSAQLESELRLARGQRAERGWDADPPAAHVRTSITKANGRILISAFRKWAASQWHPDRYQGKDKDTKLATANAIIDWLEKCVEQLREQR